MKRRIQVTVCTLLYILFAAPGYAQRINGTVKDTTGEPVMYATVSLKDSISNTILAYTITDRKGSFTLQAPENMPASGFKMEARSLGYETVVKNIAGFDIPVDFILRIMPNELQGVVIRNSRPVLRTHGDTLIYKVSEFSSANDRTIGEVLKKMPGITVAADGTISYNNKQISALYIDGDNLLDDKYNIATNSIPQGAVNQVQVIQNNQPIKILQNKVMSEDVALNLTFQKGAKLHLIGQESIGAGLPGNYDINLNGMMFKNNYKAINYLGGNNIGYDVRRELISHNLADYLQRIDNPLPQALLSLGNTNTPELAQNRYLFNKAGILNFNNLINLEKSVQLKVNAYYVHDAQQQDYNRQTVIFLPGGEVKYNEVQHSRINPDVVHTQFTLNINRDKYYLTNVLQVDNNTMRSESGLKTDSVAVNQELKNYTKTFLNEFNFIRSLKSHNIIQAYSYISHSTGPENRVIDPGYNASIFNNNIPYARLVQNVNIPSWYNNNYFSFRIPSGSITQRYRTGFSIQSQRLISGLNVIESNNGVKPVDSALNHVNWTKTKLYAEAAYDLPGTVLKANLTLPVILQRIKYSDNSHLLSKRLPGLYFTPQLQVKYQVSKENYANFSYSYRNQIGTIENIYPGYILTDYRTFYANNASLTEQQIHQAGGGFNYRKALKLFFWSVGAFYTHTKANNIKSAVISNNIQKGIVLPYINGTDLWTIGGSISKYLFALKTTLSGTIQWQSSRSVQIQNNLLLPFNTTTNQFNMNADTRVNDVLNFSYKAALTRTGSQSAIETSIHQVNRLLQEASVNYNPVDILQLKLSCEHYFTWQEGNPDLSCFFADASIRYKATRWKIDFELNAVNLLNVKNYNALYLSGNTLTNSAYTLPGRIVMLKMMFNL